MKKSVFVQILLLLGVMLLGFFLKINPISGPRILHKLIGFVAGFVSIITTFIAFKEKYPVVIQRLAIAAVIFTLFAGIGGSLLYRIPSYMTAYYLMVVSATLALLTSATLAYKLRKA